jgi:hypothetical protein
MGGFCYVSACAWVGKFHPGTCVGAALARRREADAIGGYLGDLLGCGSWND